MEPGLASKVFEILKNDKFNRFCADCNIQSAGFGDIDYGTFICYKCVALHREINVDSIIKVLADEVWDVDEIKVMIAGGNAALRDYFKYYRITIETPMLLKYKTRAAAFYRNMLAEIAREGNFEGSFLSFEDGNRPDQEEHINSPPPPAQQAPEAQALASVPKETPREMFFSPPPETGIRSWFVRKFNQIREAGNKAFKTVNEFGNNDVMRDIEFISVGIANNVKSPFISTAEEDIDHKFLEKYKQNIATSTAHTFLEINLNSNSQSIKKEAMDTLVKKESMDTLVDQQANEN
ncbi:unnamed protein product [Blepharisma stoltei]|uniref:Arf-GAP domain-containing protein n=1 Tax=Blepharisma stoltei TaxID=1481888 RepID=A0AAU9ISA2_9CILI|nr:unnamed protein product [Blepharisma stoltei]